MVCMNLQLYLLAKHTGRGFLLDACYPDSAHDGRWDKDKDFPTVGSELVHGVRVRVRVSGRVR